MHSNLDHTHADNSEKSLGEKFLDKLKHKLYYNQKCLKPAATHKDFLEEISYKVDLEQLYYISDTLINNYSMYISPVLMEIKNELLREQSGYNYFLQLWYYKAIKAHQIPLKAKPSLWGMTKYYFLYKPSPCDEYHEDIFILHFDENWTCVDSIVRIKDIGNDQDYKILHFLEDSNLLIVATHDQIMMVSVPQEHFKEENSVLDKKDLQSRIIEPRLKLHGIYCDLFTFELLDNQLDFNELKIEFFDSDDFSYSFQQYSEIMPRTCSSDPITKVVFQKESSWTYAIALRKSGRFDIYWDYQLKYSSESIIATDIGINLLSLYFKISQNGSESIYRIDHEQLRSINWDMAVKEDSQAFRWDKICHHNGMKIIYMYKNFQILSAESTYIVISHMEYLSVFDVIKNDWVKHMKFNDEVVYFFPVLNFNYAILKNGQVYIFEIQDMKLTQKDLLLEFNEDDIKYTIGGKIHKLSFSQVKKEFALILHDDSDGVVQLSLISNDKVTEITSLLKDAQLSSDTSLTLFQGIGTETQFNFILNDGDLKQVALDITNFPTIDVEEKLLDQECKSAFDTHTPHAHTVFQKGDDKEGENLVFIGNDHFLTYHLKKKTTDIAVYQYANSAILPSDNVIYGLCDGGRVSNCGLYFYYLNNLITFTKSTVKWLNVDNFAIGSNSQMIYSEQEERIGYFSSMFEITIFPLLHRNKNKFLGIQKPQDYLAHKVLKDKFICLHQRGELQTWNLVTGKYISGTQLTDKWFLDYGNYGTNGEENRNRQDRQLLRSNEPLLDTKLEDYYDAQQLQVNLQNQKNYNQLRDQKIYNWKYIEIVNENEIIEYNNFDFPDFDLQYLYIGKNVDQEPLMIQRLLYSKVYLYQQVRLGGNKVRWQLIRKLHNYDSEMECTDQKYYVPFYSPDLSYHIELNRQEKGFQIRETVTNSLYTKIPHEILNFDKLSSLAAINRVQWLDNRLIRIVNLEGVEKIMDVHDNFKEVESNVIPLFKTHDYHTGFEELPYFFEREYTSIEDTEGLLRKKYQQYKSAQNLFHKHDFVSLSQVLYTVDTKDMQYNNLSFSYQHWNLIDKICIGRYNVEDINEDDIQSVLFCILPGGNTFMHKICQHDQADDLDAMFKIAQPNYQDIENIKYHVPMFQNHLKESPLHIARNLQDYKSIDTMLRYLGGYGLDHHSEAIKDLLPHFIDKDLQSMPGYLKSRMRQTDQIKVISKKKLKKGFEDTFPFQMWFKQADLDAKVVDELSIETRIQCQYIDMPNVYHYSGENFQDYMDALAGTANYNYFTLKPIQKIIEFNYPLVKEYIIKRLFIPYIMFLTTFVVFKNNFFEGYYSLQQMKNDESRQEEFNTVENIEMYNQMYTKNIIFSALLLLFSTFFLANEAKQFWGNKLEYFQSFWNYIDILPPTLIYASIFLNLAYSGINEQTERSLMALTTFFIWFKLLYFMRIFKDTGYLIRMISTVMIDMRHFLFVLLIAIVAFGDTFLSISMGNPDMVEGDYGYEQNPARFTHGFLHSILYTYTVILGGFDVSTYENSIAYILVMVLFLLCTVFNMIVMLNLLIAIISESFANVNGNATNAMYQEMVSLIAENNYLIPDSRKEDYAPANLNLLVITDLEAVEDNEYSDPVQESLKEIKEKLTEQGAEVSSRMEENAKSFKELKTGMEEQATKLESLEQLIKSYFVKNAEEVNE